MRVFSLRNRRGSNAVEFAVTVPLLLILCLGVAEYGLFLQQAVDMVEASQAGAGEAAARSDTIVETALDDATAALALETLATAGCNATLTARGRGLTGCSAAMVTVAGLGGPGIAVTATVDYSPIGSGFVPVPDATSYTTTMPIVALNP